MTEAEDKEKAEKLAAAKKKVCAGYLMQGLAQYLRLTRYPVRTIEEAEG
jgi:hypothetical protein